MSTLNARQQFIKNCFGEIREQISLGITTEQSKRDPNTQKWLPTDYSQRRARLFDKVKNELDSSKKLFVPSWNLKNVDEKDVFDAIVIFYLICDCYGKEDKAIEEALNHFVDIAAYRKFPPSLQNVGAQAKTHQVIKSILAAFGDIEENEEGEVKEDDKMASLIWKYFGYFPYATDEFGNPIKNKKTEKYVSVDVAHSAQLLHFNRHIRNAMAHKNKEFEPKYRQEIAVQFLYNYIIVVYMLKFYLKREFSAKFADYYKNHRKDYNIPVYIKGVEKPTTLISEVGNIEVKEAGQYKLSPFTDYSFDGFDATFDLNEYCYNATITPPSETDYDTIIDLPQEGVNDGLKKELEDIKKAIEDNLKKGERDAARKIVGEKLAQIEGLTLVCNAIKDDVEGLKEQQTEVKNDLKTLLDSSKTLDEICKKINKFCKNSDSYKELESALENVSTELTRVGGIVADIKKMLLRFVKGGCVVLVIGVLFALLFLFVRYATSPILYKCEFAANTAHYWGNKDVAMHRAFYLDSVKNDSWKASKCYKEAIRRYEELLQKDSTDTERAGWLAIMMMRGKGGTIDTYRAEKYAHLAKRYDLEAYLAITNGDMYKASELLNNYYYERTFSDVIFTSETEFGNYDRNSSYFVLAKALKNLLYSKQYNTMSEFGIIDSLSKQVGSPARLEALLSSISLRSKGIKKNSNGYYCCEPSLRYCFEQAKIASEEFNSIQAQLYLAKEYARFRIFGEVNYEEKALRNGCDPMEFGFVDDIKLRTLNPAILIYKAKENAKKGSNEYYLTAKYYHIADSLYQCSPKEPEEHFYEEWFDCIVNAHDLSSDSQVLQLVNKNFPDSIRKAVVDYVMALKYRKGKGVKRDIQISNERLRLAASKGLVDARVAYDIICDIDGNLEGMTDLENLVSSCTTIRDLQNSYSQLNNCQGFDEENAYIYAWRYIISKGINREEIDAYSHIIPWNNLQLYRFHNGRELVGGTHETSYLELIIERLEYGISQIYKKYNDDSEIGNNGYSFLIGKLAECYYLLDDTISADFYTNIAKHCLGSQAYPSFFAMSECARKIGNKKDAEKYAQLFADIYFEKGWNGKRQVADDAYRVDVVNHFAHLYPGILDEVVQRTGYDFRDDVASIQPLDESKKQSWQSPVGHIKMTKYVPNCEKPIFPVSMKYFN